MLTNGSTAMLFSGMAVSDVVGLRETIMTHDFFEARIAAERVPEGVQF